MNKNKSTSPKVLTKILTFPKLILTFAKMDVNLDWKRSSKPNIKRLGMFVAILAARYAFYFGLCYLAVFVVKELVKAFYP